MTTIKTQSELREEALLFRLWSYFIECGIPLLDAVRRLAGMFPNFGAPLSAIGDEVKQGEDMRTSFGGQEKFFSECVPDIVDFGANSGVLHETLLEMSLYLQKTKNLVLAGAPSEKICEVNFYRLYSFCESIGVQPVRAFKCVGKVFLPDEAIISVLSEVDAGNMLSDGLVRYPQFFTEEDRQAIYRGELRGNLGDVAVLLAESKEKKLLASAPASEQQAGNSEVSEVISEFSELSEMVDSGVPLVIGLDTLAEHSSDVRSNTLIRVRQKMLGGDMFSEAVASMSDSFPPEIVPIIKSGEYGGTLEVGLGLVVRYLKWKMLNAD